MAVDGVQAEAHRSQVWDGGDAAWSRGPPSGRRIVGAGWKPVGLRLRDLTSAHALHGDLGRLGSPSHTLVEAVNPGELGLAELEVEDVAVLSDALRLGPFVTIRRRRPIGKLESLSASRRLPRLRTTPCWAAI